tara:strand:+ start:1688 stop:1810 length:123 start_codon:yes stop_codon:yes gene_type:complete
MLKIKFEYCPILGLKWYEIKETISIDKSKKQKRTFKPKKL